MSADFFIHYAYLLALIAALGIAAVLSQWLADNPHAALTRWLDKQFKRCGF